MSKHIFYWFGRLRSDSMKNALKLIKFRYKLIAFALKNKNFNLSQWFNVCTIMVCLAALSLISIFFPLIPSPWTSNNNYSHISTCSTNKLFRMHNIYLRRLIAQQWKVWNNLAGNWSAIYFYDFLSGCRHNIIMFWSSPLDTWYLVRLCSLLMDDETQISLGRLCVGEIISSSINCQIGKKNWVGITDRQRFMGF